MQLLEVTGDLVCDWRTPFLFQDGGDGELGQPTQEMTYDSPQPFKVYMSCVRVLYAPFHGLPPLQLIHLFVPASFAPSLVIANNTAPRRG